METRNRISAHLAPAPLFDELTGLYSREGLLSHVQQLLKLASRTKRGILLVAADLEGLKRINDAFGHHEGDVALVKTADLLQGTFRKSDVIACCGGDDFLIATIETRKDSADALTQRLRENVRRYNEAHEGRYRLSLRVTASAIDPDEALSTEDLSAKIRELLAKRDDASFN